MISIMNVVEITIPSPFQHHSATDFIVIVLLLVVAPPGRHINAHYQTNLQEKTIMLLVQQDQVKMLIQTVGSTKNDLRKHNATSTIDHYSDSQRYCCCFTALHLWTMDNAKSENFFVKIRPCGCFLGVSSDSSSRHLREARIARPNHLNIAPYRDE